jgi:hypothetical protein
VVSEIDVNNLHGTVVAVPCVNVAGYLKFQREFADGRDLNRLFPGREDGFASQVFCYQLMNKVISQFNYLIDLHTASFGRVNSYYVRADMVKICESSIKVIFLIYLYRMILVLLSWLDYNNLKLFYTTLDKMVHFDQLLLQEVFALLR